MADAHTPEPQLPPHWQAGPGDEGGERLTFAVRQGGGHVFLLGASAASTLSGAVFALWLLGGELTLAGAVFTLLVPGGMILFGVYALDLALWRRDEYLLSRYVFSARRHSLFGARRRDIPRQEIVGIHQRYTPPDASSAAGAPGHWTTFIASRDADGTDRELPIDGLRTAAEARWLAAVLVAWAGVPLLRVHADDGDADDLAPPPEP